LNSDNEEMRSDQDVVVPAGDAIPREPDPPEMDLAVALRAALREGRTLTELILDMARLGWGQSRLSPREYFGLGLHSAGISRDEKGRFLGRTAQDRLLKPHTRSLGAGLADDKLRFELLMRGAGLPVPNTRAVVKADAPPGRATLREEAEVVSYLKAVDHYPVFAKPVHGIRSGGSALLVRLEDGGRVVRVGPHRVDLQDLVRYLLDAEDSYLLQDVLRPSPATREWAGDRLVSARIVLTPRDGEPTIHAALAKIPVGANHVDNFWRSGNIAAGLDPATGRVVRAMASTQGLPVEVAEHPDTGAALTDVVLPDWSATRDMVVAAAPHFPGLRIQAWDVALAEGGPCLLEVNIGGDFVLPQVALGRGIATDDFMAVLKDPS
jgi:hypothetical protein